jgi:hypothetical protein
MDLQVGAAPGSADAHPRRLPTVVRWPVFLLGLGLLVVCGLGNPIILKGSLVSDLVFVVAVAASVVAYLVYAVGLRSFLRRYERADVRFVFVPVVASAFLGFLAPAVIILLLWIGHLLGAV